MNNCTFNTLKDVYNAAIFWYGNTDIDSCCLVENRLMKGEKPNEQSKEVPTLSGFQGGMCCPPTR